MKTIKLAMNITAEEALAEWDALPEATTPKHITAAYYRRAKQLKAGDTTPVTYAVFENKPTNPAPLHTPAPELDRRVAAKSMGTLPRTVKPPVRPPAPAKPKFTADLKPKPTPAQAAALKANRTRTGRIPEIDPEDAGAIHRRINQLAETLGYGDIGFGINPVFGGMNQFSRKTGVTSQSSTHDTIRTGKKIWPAVINGIVENFGANREWLLHGTGEMLYAVTHHRHFEPSRQKQPSQSWTKTATASLGNQTLADALRTPTNWQPHAKRPPGGVIFDPLAFNADQTFSIIGPAAYTSRYANAKK